MHDSKTYRHDIDGLRALAVLSVIVFHSFPTLHFNGFVGVDMFFVISGFLITKNIAGEMLSGHFSIMNFYLRRIKRILPVFYTITVVVLIFSILIMLPEDLKSVGKSTFAAIFSASNIYFWNSTDNNYFAKTSELYPMLHTWSLGVEEQFYFVWPLILSLLLKLNMLKRGALISAVLAIASYAFAQWALSYDASFAYYMLPSRAGELLTGSIISFVTMKWKAPARNGVLFEILSIAGLLLILASFLVKSFGAPFPGLNALYPCVGTALILYAGTYQSTWVAKLLSLKPLAFVGLISYSLYLWHWPVLAFLKYLLVVLTLPWLILALVIIFTLSICSWKWIENPFRKMKLRTGQVFAFYLALPCLLIGGTSIYLYETDGLFHFISSSRQYKDAAAVYSENTSPAYNQHGVCQSEKYLAQKFTDKKCIMGNQVERGLGNEEPKILLWGDSHASHFVGFFEAITKGQNLPIRNIELGGCPPVFKNQIEYGKTRDKPSCTDFRKKVQDLVPNYECMILGGIWSEYSNDPLFISDLEETINEILNKGKKAVLLLQVPAFPTYARNCLLRNNRAFAMDCIGHAKYEDKGDSKTNSNIRSRLGERKNLFYLNIHDLICERGACSPYADGVPVYYDPSHLSAIGSGILGSKFLSTQESETLIHFLKKESQ